LVNDSYIPSYNETPLAMLIYRARWDYRMHISLVADVLYPFHVAELMTDIASGIGESPSSDSDPAASATPGISLLDVENKKEVDIFDITALADDQTLYLTLVAVSLHVDKAAALASGLFGLVGDFPVQTVDFDNLDRLHRFYELYDADANLKRRASCGKALQHHLQPRIPRWRALVAEESKVASASCRVEEYAKVSARKLRGHRPRASVETSCAAGAALHADGRDHV
jgi:hypothetical protein